MVICAWKCFEVLLLGSVYLWILDDYVFYWGVSFSLFLLLGVPTDFRFFLTGRNIFSLSSFVCLLVSVWFPRSAFFARILIGSRGYQLIGVLYNF
jgi:hypothetical protein